MSSGDDPDHAAGAAESAGLDPASGAGAGSLVGSGRRSPWNGRCTWRPDQREALTRFARSTALAILVLMLLAAPLAAEAQQPKVARIGFLSPTSASSNTDRVEALGRDCVTLATWKGRTSPSSSAGADEKYGRLPDLAAELVRLNVEVIVTAGTPAIRAVKNATTTMPSSVLARADEVIQ